MSGHRSSSRLPSRKTSSEAVGGEEDDAVASHSFESNTTNSDAVEGRHRDHSDDDDDDDIVRHHSPTTNGNTAQGIPGDGLTLREMADRACKKIYIGAAVQPKPLFTPDVEALHSDEADNPFDLLSSSPNEETRYARVLRTEFNAVVVEHHLKWAPLCVSEPGPLEGTSSDRLGRYDFHHAESIVDWALKHGMKVKGHVLVWHVTSPKFLEDLEPEEIRKQLRLHIFTVLGRFRGRIQEWDVVNESLAPDGTLAENVFLRKLGPSYIEEAFRWAHEADPSAILLYNDNKVEGIGTKKGDAFYELLADLKAKQVPVHGCGMQAHFNAAGVGRNRPPTPRMVKEQIRRLGKLGLSVNISEMDVRVSQLEPELRQQAQRQIYHEIIAAALSEPAFDGIWLWGFTDRHTWVSSFYYDDEPLIFDEDYRRKEAYYGLRDAISSLTPHGRVGGEGVLLDKDVDIEGNPWGHLWIRGEPEGIDETEATGDSRPDWERVPEAKETAKGADSARGEKKKGRAKLAGNEKEVQFEDNEGARESEERSLDDTEDHDDHDDDEDDGIEDEVIHHESQFELPEIS